MKGKDGNVMKANKSSSKVHRRPHVSDTPLPQCINLTNDIKVRCVPPRPSSIKIKSSKINKQKKQLHRRQISLAEFEEKRTCHRRSASDSVLYSFSFDSMIEMHRTEPRYPISRSIKTFLPRTASLKEANMINITESETFSSQPDSFPNHNRNKKNAGINSTSPTSLKEVVRMINDNERKIPLLERDDFPDYNEDKEIVEINLTSPRSLREVVRIINNTEREIDPSERDCFSDHYEETEIAGMHLTPLDEDTLVGLAFAHEIAQE